MRNRRRLLLIAMLFLLGGSSAIYALFFTFATPQSSCPPVLTFGTPTLVQLPSLNFGAITKFALPSPQRDPNGIVVVSDGSVWFGEQSLPGLGHLFSNGTLREYIFPGTYEGLAGSGYSCSHKTDIGAVAIWHQMIWATDTAQHRLIALDPSVGSYKTIRLPENSYPYTLTLGSNDSLWFTRLRSFIISMIDSSGGLHNYQLPDYVVPTEVAFVDGGAVGYFTDPGIAGFGSLYSFNPQQPSPKRVIGTAGTRVLFGPQSVSVGSSGKVWVAEYGGSRISVYDPLNNDWASYPTSKVGYSDLTLPFLVRANGSKVWFSEYLGNRIGVINYSAGNLIEFSVSNPQARSFSQIAGVHTIALGKNRIWFTNSAEDNIGYVNDTYRPGFSVSLQGRSSIDMRSFGGTQNFTLSLSGRSDGPLTVQFSDTETRLGSLQNISLMASPASIGLLNGTQKIGLTLNVVANMHPGNYMLAISITDGLISESVYVSLNISQ